MTTTEYRVGDVVDIVFRRAVVTEVHDRHGTLAIVHSDQEMPRFDPEAVDVEVTVVGYEDPEKWL